MNIKIPLLLLLLVVTSNTFAQYYFEGGDQKPPQFPVANQSRSTTINKSNQTSIENIPKVQYETLFETVDWKYPGINFMPKGIGEYAGDINGDGIDDLLRPYWRIFNLDTEDPTDIVSRSLIFYGGESRKLLPDHYVNSYLRPAGDMNGDGFADAIGINYDNSSTIFLGSETGFIESGNIAVELNRWHKTVGFIDFNGDGYGDILHHDTYFSGETSYLIVFGGKDVSEFKQVQYTSPTEQPKLQSVKHGDKDLLFEFWVDEDDQLQYFAKEFDKDTDTAVTRLGGSYDLSDLNAQYYFFKVHPIDINKDEFEDILISMSYYYGGDQNMVFENAPHGLSSEYSILQSSLEWVPSGDFNNDGFNDFIVKKLDKNFSIGLAEPGPKFNIVPSEKLIIKNPGSPYFNLDAPFYFGDINGDGFDDLQLPFSNDKGHGNQTIFGNETGVDMLTEEVFYTNEDFEKAPALRSSQTLKDFNGDNINDLALLYEDRIDIHFGGQTITVPDLTINFSEAHTRLSEITVGNFNGDQFTDIAVTVNLDVGKQVTQKQIELYYGSENPDNMLDHTIISPISTISHNFPLSISNAGDMNADGIDDMVISTVGLYTAILYYGGKNISTGEADVTINLPSPYYGKTNSIPLFSYFMKGIGDANGDGIDDLAISDLHHDISNGSRRANDAGQVCIIYGDTDLDKEIRVSKLLTQESLSLTKNIRFLGWSMTAADINGDGSNDLIVMPGIFSETEEKKVGIDGIFVYQQAWKSGSKEDLSFPLYSTPFGGNGDQLAEFQGELLTVPDLDNDGADELLLTTSLTNRNAALFMGGSSYDFNADAILESPNSVLPLGTSKHFVNVQNRSAIGDFNNDGILEVILPQMRDDNYQNTPVYVFPLEAPEKKTQEIRFDPIYTQVDPLNAFRLKGIATSGLPIVYEVMEGPATVEGSTLRLTGENGKVVIKAMQEGDENYYAAESVERIFEVLIVTDAKKEISKSMIVYPNPATDQVSIKSDLFSHEKISRVEIMSMSGQAIKNIAGYQQSGEILTLNLGSLESGVYFVNIQSPSENALIRIIKN